MCVNNQNKYPEKMTGVIDNYNIKHPHENKQYYFS